jgi:signal transduction histidine kinase
MVEPAAPRRHTSMFVAAASVGALALAALAARADQHGVDAHPGLTSLDVAVGLAFVAAGLAASGPPRQRLLVGAVGPAWMLGSLFHSALSLHQGVLGIALLTFPAGRLRGRLRLVLGVCAVVVASEVMPQLGVAMFFAVLGVAVRSRAGRVAAPDVYPAAAGATVAAVLVFAWWSDRHADLTSALVIYEVTLLVVAAGYSLASRAIARANGGLADEVLRSVGLDGVGGLRLVLAGVLEDPALRIELSDTATARLAKAAAVGGDGQTAGGIAVHDGDELIARVITTSPATTDARTTAAVIAAVRLSVVNQRLRAQQAAQVAQVEASRERLLAAGDREREKIATRLRAEAGADLHQALLELGRAMSDAVPEVTGLIDFASSQVAAAAAEVERIVRGVPPMSLGAGQLRNAVISLASRGPVPVTLQIADDVATDFAVETALFYVCSEALANAAKHSEATNIVVDLRRQEHELVLTVRDNGLGGADSSGSGLRGLADRLGIIGGHLLVVSPVGGGTTIQATVPAPSARNRQGP